MIEIWHVWLIAGLVCFGVEMLTPEFVMGSVGFGCLGAGAAAFFGAPVNGQLMAFILVTLALMFAIRPRVKRWLHRGGDPRQTGVAALVGQIGKVEEAIPGGEDAGRVHLGSESWRAVSSIGKPIEVGDSVRVVSVDAATLSVQPIQPNLKGE